MDTNFYMPVQVRMGRDIVEKSGALLAGMGRRAMLVTGRSSAVKCGAQADVTAALEKNGQTWVVFDQVMSNPTVDCVYAGAELAKREGVDFLIAIGGGSPMDAAKAIALLARQEIAAEDLFKGGFGGDVLPMVHIPTTAGTGSEVTQYAILTNDAAQTKTSLAGPMLFSRLALLDGKYMLGLGPRTTVNTAVDALSHAVEGMLSVKANPTTDLLAADAITRIVRNYDGLLHDTLTAEQRDELLYASMLGGAVIAQTGTTAVHSMGYSLTYFWETDHGRANGLLLADYLRLLLERGYEKTSQVLDLMGMDHPEALRAWLDSLLGQRETIAPAEVEKFSSIAIQAGNIANCPTALRREDLAEVYRRAFALA